MFHFSVGCYFAGIFSPNVLHILLIITKFATRNSGLKTLF